MIENKKNKAWVIAVDMGYGHQRAAYPLHDIAYKGIIAANEYAGLPTSERKTWRNSREAYEWVSRQQPKPLIGKAIFEIFDKIQEIPSFYPKRDLSKPNVQLAQTYYLIEKEGLCKHLFTKVLAKNDKLPLITTFFLVAFAAEIYGYNGDIYLQVCDADISRTWAPRDPKKSRIKYLAPNKRVVDRLKLYGVRPENIFFTGFPLPKENIGGEDLEILRKDLGARIYNLDPAKKMVYRFGHIVNYHLGKKYIPKRATHPLTLTFAIGGAGAQKELGANIIKSLKTRLIQNQLNINLIAGVRKEIVKYYKDILKENGLSSRIDKNIHILYTDTKIQYFEKFNLLLRKTDILWTKPSELSFYVGLGIPLIMAPSIGSQEDFNRLWLKTIAAGITQDDPRYTDEWLFDWIESGWLARAALNGFAEAPIKGAYNIEKLIFNKVKHLKDPSLLAF